MKFREYLNEGKSDHKEVVELWKDFEHWFNDFIVPVKAKGEDPTDRKAYQNMKDALKIKDEFRVLYARLGKIAKNH